MSLELMRKWVNSLPPAERNLPLLHVGNAFYTPLQALHEVERGTAIGEELQKLVEEGRFGTDVTALAKARLKLILEEAGGYKIASLSGKTYDPTEIAKKIESDEWDDPALKQLLATEIMIAEQDLKIAEKLKPPSEEED